MRPQQSFPSPFFSSVLVVAVMFAVNVVSGCSGDSGEASLCDGESVCSGHGTCAVAGGDTAICVCDPGFHSAGGGLTCVENVAGSECAGVDCNVDGVCAVSGGAPVCVCGAGFHATSATVCVADTPTGAGGACLSSTDCGTEQICERLSGRCTDIADVTCGTGADPITGTQGVGGFCVIGSVAETDACSLLIGGGSLDAGSFCQTGLRCAPGSPVGASARVCRAADVSTGVCREVCDPCTADSCPTAEACGNVPAVGGICMPTGFSANRCGYSLCQPGWSCVTEVAPGEPANGQCGMRCDLDTLECPGGMLCDGTGTCLAGHYVDEGQECNQVVDTGVCRPGFGCAFSAAGWRCVAL